MAAPRAEVDIAAMIDFAVAEEAFIKLPQPLSLECYYYRDAAFVAVVGRLRSERRGAQAPCRDGAMKRASRRFRWLRRRRLCLVIARMRRAW